MVSRGQAQRGFTLVEIMMVVIIIGVLAAMIVPKFAGRTEQAKIARAKSDIAAIGVALDLYEMDTGRYPESSEWPSALVSDQPSGGSSAAQSQWKGPYLKKKGAVNDPWGHEYQYTKEGNSYKLVSLGPDGQQGNDDISSEE